MNIFKLGARVRRINTRHFGIGVVTSMKNHDGHIEIKFENRQAPWTTTRGCEEMYEFLPEGKPVEKKVEPITVGAHVRHDRHPEYGNGRVRYIHPNSKSLAVEFENPTNLVHDCAGHGKPNHSRWSRAESLSVINPFKVGDTVLMCAFDDRVNSRDGGFWYTEEFAGKQGTVTAVGKDYVDVTIRPSLSQYVHINDCTLVKVDPVEAVRRATPKVRTVAFKSGSQCDRIVKYLLTGSSITPIKARALFGAERLAARMLEIRQAGHKVKSVIKTDLNGKVYAEYSLRNAGRVWA
ncbi:helix-turn-helix domain-containing protein [Rhizobium sp. IMFF44]|uniref:helix-turn-helix domain-containing protein n=1 Tax=Rhizobium sp. IMFF44 TaxID=3342350 RepID=UPI0035BA8F36